LEKIVYMVNVCFGSENPVGYAEGFVEQSSGSFDMFLLDFRRQVVKKSLGY
jgi:hypothetical protein